MYTKNMHKRTVVITGARRGLGLSLAKEFSSNGWHVIGTGKSPRSAELPDEIDYVQFDASTAEACTAFWQDTLAAHSEDELCLVNNAGGFVAGSLQDTAPEEYEKQLRMNYLPAVYMTKGLVGGAKKARIFTIISATALKPMAKNTAYGASKAAEQYFLQALQAEVDPHKFQITNIYPNSIATTGPNLKAIIPEELARFVREQAELKTSYYIRDVTLQSFI